MKYKRITLADGRYLIFYSFDDEAQSQTSLPPAKTGVERAGEPDAQPEAPEERNV